jgi:hypothetical protein
MDNEQTPPLAKRNWTLADIGFRFIRRRKEFNWVHPNEVRSTDTDCTEMDDESFEREVADAGRSL